MYASWWHLKPANMGRTGRITFTSTSNPPETDFFFELDSSKHIATKIQRIQSIYQYPCKPLTTRKYYQNKQTILKNPTEIVALNLYYKVCCYHTKGQYITLVYIILLLTQTSAKNPFAKKKHRFQLPQVFKYAIYNYPPWTKNIAFEHWPMEVWRFLLEKPPFLGANC